MSETKMYKGVPIEEYRALTQSKKESILKLLKGVTYEQYRDIIWLVRDEIENQIKQTKLE